MTINVIHGDCLEVIPKLVAGGLVVDAVCCDPPYNLTATASRFSKNGSAPAKYGKDGAHQRVARGFMQSAWDTDVAFHSDTWATIATAMRPGAFLVAFGGTRTVHRLACAIDDAGFIIQDSILNLISSDTRIQRFVASLTPTQVDAFSQVLDDLQPTGSLAWCFGTGFPKRRDMLKPAFEPLVLAYKPGGKRTMQIDACRIAPASIEDIEQQRRCVGFNVSYSHGESGVSLAGSVDGSLHKRDRTEFDPTKGRWPANTCTDGSDEVIAAFPLSAGQQGDVKGTEPSHTGEYGIYGTFGRVPFKKREGEASQDRRYTTNGSTNFAALPGARRSDPGSAARFFYSAKAGKLDRWGSRHPTIKPIALMRWLVRLITPPGGTILDPFAGSGTTGIAAIAEGFDCTLIERDDTYAADIRARLAHFEGEGRRSLDTKSKPVPAKSESLTGTLL